MCVGIWVINSFFVIMTWVTDFTKMAKISLFYCLNESRVKSILLTDEALVGGVY